MLKQVSKKAAGINSRVCAVLGGQWGDEGKGKLADVLAKNYDIVARFNGGNNAGHTVVVNDKKYAFHFFFRRTVKINSLYERKLKTPNIGIRENVSELLNKNQDPGLKMIIDSIINGEDYIFKAEDHYDSKEVKLDPDREYL